jgi:hypothetical protein
MTREFDTVVLVRDLGVHHLRAGDIGAVVHCYADGKTFEVEFVTGDGKTVAVVTLSEADVLPMNGEEILHVRALVTA